MLFKIVKFTLSFLADGNAGGFHIDLLYEGGECETAWSSFDCKKVTPYGALARAKARALAHHSHLSISHTGLHLSKTSYIPIFPHHSIKTRLVLPMWRDSPCQRS